MTRNVSTEPANGCHQTWLERVRRSLPAVDRVLTRFGHLSLTDYVAQLQAAVKPPFQGRDTLIHLLDDTISSLLGEATAKRAMKDLAAQPLVLTTSHHGVDYYAQTLQSRLILALRTTSRLSSAKTLVVFACGNVPLNNLTYPRGLLLYRLVAGGWDEAPQRLPLFPHRLKRTMVSVTPAWDTGMIGQARARLERMIHQGRVASDVGLAARTLLEEDYPTAIWRGHSGYSTQAVMLNRLIWKRLFAGDIEPPELIYLELEQVASGLLRLDLANPRSLAWGVLFDSKLRERVLAELDGARGCWDQALLSQGAGAVGGEGRRLVAGQTCGTVFFWGVDQRGRRVPLSLQTAASGKVVLRGWDEGGSEWQFPWVPREIARAVEERRLLPSLFTAFLVIAFARGVCCIGGYYQGEYLPAMQRGLAKALQQTGGYAEAARAVLEVPTALYLDGMTAVMAHPEVGFLIPAGPLEIIAGGGLTRKDLTAVGSLTVTEAHLADLSETVPDGTLPEARTPGWQRRLAGAACRALEGRIVIK